MKLSLFSLIILCALILACAIFGGFVYMAWHLADLLPLLNYVTITKGNVIYYLHFSPPVM